MESVPLSSHKDAPKPWVRQLQRLEGLGRSREPSLLVQYSRELGLIARLDLILIDYH